MSMAVVPGRPTRGTPEDVLRHFGSADGKALGLRLLRAAAADRDADGVELALMVCFTFGFTADQLDTLIQLSSEDWHHRHEDVISALDELRTPAAVPALYQATQWVPDYLDFDDTRALATKAIWALGNIPTPEAEEALRRLLDSDDEILRDGARAQLARRAEQP
jgi:hypothetical protein